ncbi:hypothetical protein PF005_g8505 [Phytophthora fragariae]|uniref:Myb-like domain-containing protein n=1 Tax=Phytophthora fragariae TaxID=53985 RepID=A0A6A4E038_9STRA|nr:hypothetical protein PF011_g7258 [Phytophthora fragariae]KAE9147161.1 hypothetical protein PF006_g8126 [Phytophthora fragariae]KAE9217825.1 hypothetical protein PF005_g8505 [Phytophthora fragariae]KAE9239369.1 hypothetical protein PF004_g7970 [Phytophthora fragariae]KAE9314964.1 hypothetical protein PF001_g8019 [Phytophthora fragariae]
MPNATPWSVEEDMRLCKAYTNISEDGAPATVARKPGALQTRWAGLIRPDVALYASCLAAVEAQQRSGCTEQDYTNEAANLQQSRSNETLTRYVNTMKVELHGSVRFMRDIPAPRKQPCQPCEHDESGLLDDDGADSEDSDKQDTDEANISSMDSFQSPIGALHAVRPTSAGEKKAK